MVRSTMDLVLNWRILAFIDKGCVTTRQYVCMYPKSLERGSFSNVCTILSLRYKLISIVISKQRPHHSITELSNHRDNVTVLDRLLLLVWSVKNQIMLMLNVNMGPGDHKTPQYCHYRTLYWLGSVWRPADQARPRAQLSVTIPSHNKTNTH